MATHDEGVNTKPATCRDCGQALEIGQGNVYSIFDYDWDNPDTNAQGSVMVEMDRYALCANATQCAERVIERGTNFAALLAILHDTEHYPAELRTKARAILADYSRITQDIQHAADLTAREAGYGAIGGYRGQSDV